MAYTGKPIVIAVPYRCDQCGALYRRNAAVDFQRDFCSHKCLTAAIVEAAAAKARAKLESV
jgi:hypothetical protein